MFTKRKSIKQIEEGKDLAPKFDKTGLIPVITTDYKNGNVLMHGYMNRQALKKNNRNRRSLLLEQVKKNNMA